MVDETRGRRSGSRLAPALVFAGSLLAALAFAIGHRESGAMLAADLWQALLNAPEPVFFGFMAVALVLPVPASLLYAAAGPIFGVLPSLAWIAPTLALNAFLVHLIGTTAVRPTLLRWIEGRGLRVPTLEDPSDQLTFATVVRVTPGVPYFVQSWLIVLAGIRRGPFIALSVGIQILYASGFVVLGRSAFEGRMGLGLTALAFLFVAALVARQTHRRFRDRVPTFERRRLPHLSRKEPKA